MFSDGRDSFVFASLIGKAMRPYGSVLYSRFSFEEACSSVNGLGLSASAHVSDF